jgi:carbon starvation protein
VGFLAVAIVVICPTLQMPAITQFIDGSGPVFAGAVFPFCFITIACSAISGFHAIISSGTTSKILAKEKDIRLIAYGAMITEMLVGIMALIAACTLHPGEYFAINMKGEPAAVVKKITDLGFPVSEQQMADLAARMGEKSMIGRTGGAPTFAVGMAEMFSQLVKSPAAIAIWYHFAIMFEALFILTTIDAGTRVGRFLVQDLLGLIWKPLGNTESSLGNLVASLAFVSAWGYFLYQGVVDPLGGINSFWPIFGIANQLLAVTALAFGTTVLLKMGKLRYVWVPALPLAWLLAITLTASYEKIFAADPRLGFLSAARDLTSKIAAGGSPTQIAAWNQQVLNAYVNTAITTAFFVFVLLIVSANARVWWQILIGNSYRPLQEDSMTPCVADDLR